MSRQVLDVEALMQQMIAEHRRLLAHVDAHQKAMRSMNLKEMEGAGVAQEASRLRIATMETRRRAMVNALMRLIKADGEPTARRLAELFPQRSESILKLRAELRQVVEQIQQRSHIAGKVAGAVLGHLNTVVRLMAGAVEQAGVYTKHGLPVTPGRMGMMEAVG